MSKRRAARLGAGRVAGRGVHPCAALGTSDDEGGLGYLDELGAAMQAGPLAGIGTLTNDIAGDVTRDPAVTAESGPARAGGRGLARAD